MPGSIKVKEGEVEIYTEKQTGKSKAEAKVFYNPKMEFSRDVSVAALNAFKPGTIIDAMSATGIRGLRYAKEVEGVREVVLNDISKDAYLLIHKNICHQKIKNARAENKDANVLLSKEHADAVELDPFGTPAPYMDSAARSAKKIIMATATDTTVLCGVYPKVCLRTYGSTIFKTEFCHETGLRILIASIAKTFALHDKAITPLISQSTDHYLRVFCSIEKGSRKADSALEKLGYIAYCQSCGHRKIGNQEDQECKNCKTKNKVFGPVWKKEILDKQFIGKALKHAKGFKRAEKFLTQLEKEASGHALYYDMHNICSRLKTTPPKTERIIEELEKNGFTAIKTYMKKQGLKTDCDIETLKETIKKIGK